MQSIGSVLPGSYWDYWRFLPLPASTVVWGWFIRSLLLVGLVKRKCVTFALLQAGQNLLFGPFIDRAILEANECEAGDRQCSEEAGSKTISRLAGRAVLVNGAADLTQTERAGFCA